MNTFPKSILFISNGSESGSEHALFDLLGAADMGQTRISILNRYDDYQQLHQVPCDRYYAEEIFIEHRRLMHRILDRARKRDRYYPFSRFFRKILKESKPGLIYVNNLCLPEAYDFFFGLGIPLVLHGHSLQHYLYSYNREMLVNRIRKADLVISSSRAQSRAMKLLLPEAEPEIVYPPIFLDQFQNNRESRQKTRRALGLSDNCFVWAMASTYFNYNKDPERFLEIGRRIRERSEREIALLWIGADPDATAARMARNKAKALDLSHILLFTGETSRKDYIRYLDACDGLLLVSFEESFSIVCAEAIAMGKPVVAFRCGGVEEIIQPQNGFLVEPFSLDLMADHASLIMKAPHRFGLEAMRQSVSQFDCNSLASSWKNLLESV